MRRRVVVLLSLAACGRVNFDALGDGGAGGGDGSGPADAADRPNVVFVTNTQFPGSFGGLAAADALCATVATQAGLPGTFVAWLSDSTTDARDRLAGSSGWVRTDGQPVADTVTSWLDQRQMFHPITADENRQPASPRQVWTGTTFTGAKATQTCGDWMLNTGGTRGGLSLGSVGSFTDDLFFSCGGLASLYCFEVGHAARISPLAEAGRVAFVSTSLRATGGGLAELDGICQTDATAAGLLGTFRGAAAIAGMTIASRFTIDARPWVRPDGTKIAEPADLLAATPVLTSFITQEANGTYVGPAPTYWWTGAVGAVAASGQTCANWTDVAGGGQGNIGRLAVLDPMDLFSYGTISCNQPHRILCLER